MMKACGIVSKPTINKLYLNLLANIKDTKEQMRGSFIDIVPGVWKGMHLINVSPSKCRQNILITKGKQEIQQQNGQTP